MWFFWLYMVELSVCNGENPTSGRAGTPALLSFTCVGKFAVGSLVSHLPLLFRSRQSWTARDLEVRETSS
jgi:hypothetical protein